MHLVHFSASSFHVVAAPTAPLPTVVIMFHEIIGDQALTESSSAERLDEIKIPETRPAMSTSFNSTSPRRPPGDLTDFSSSIGESSSNQGQSSEEIGAEYANIYLGPLPRSLEEYHEFRRRIFELRKDVLKKIGVDLEDEDFEMIYLLADALTTQDKGDLSSGKFLWLYYL